MGAAVNLQRNDSNLSMFRCLCPRIPSLSLRILAAEAALTPWRFRNPVSLPVGVFSKNHSITTASRDPRPCRRDDIQDVDALTKDLDGEFYNYTSGRFITNNALCLRERRRVFDVRGLLRIIAKTMNCNLDDIIGFKKLAEGGFNRIFLVTLRDDHQIVARIPYPLLGGKAHVIASEVATMALLRQKGVPVPEVLGYSCTPNNEAETEYIIMAFAEGISLSEIWFDLDDAQIRSLTEQLAKLESDFMSISFPAGGAVYFAGDLRKLSADGGIPLDEEQDIDGVPIQKDRFVIGPDVSPFMWYGRREGLDVFRGPYPSATSVLLAGAKKELAYLERFASPRAPYHRLRRQHYDYEKQSPSVHANNLRRYLRVAPSLVPEDSVLNRFCIRHPDLTENNIMVTLDSGDLKIVSLLDWQHAAIFPLFLHAGIPDAFENGPVDGSRVVPVPELPKDFAQLPEERQTQEVDTLRRRRLHYHYVRSTMRQNRDHYDAMAHHLSSLRRRIFDQSRVMWEGETIGLLYVLMETEGSWEKEFATGNQPCPIAIGLDEGRAALKLHEELRETMAQERMLTDIVGCSDNAWIPIDQYEGALVRSRDVMDKILRSVEEDGVSESELSRLRENWPLSDMSEEELEEYR